MSRSNPWSSHLNRGCRHCEVVHKCSVALILTRGMFMFKVNVCFFTKWPTDWYRSTTRGSGTTHLEHVKKSYQSIFLIAAILGENKQSFFKMRCRAVADLTEKCSFCSQIQANPGADKWNINSNTKTNEACTLRFVDGSRVKVKDPEVKGERRTLCGRKIETTGGGRRWGGFSLQLYSPCREGR